MAPLLGQGNQMLATLSLPDRHFAHSQYGPGRMAHIRYRTRLMALMGAGVTVGLLPNELFLGKDGDYSMLTGFRLAMAEALFFGALAVRRAPQTALATLTGTLGVFLLFLADFFLFPLGLLDHPPAVLATAYTVTPLVIIGITGIFPLVLVEGVCLVAVVGSFLGVGSWRVWSRLSSTCLRPSGAGHCPGWACYGCRASPCAPWLPAIFP